MATFEVTRDLDVIYVEVFAKYPGSIGLEIEDAKRLGELLLAAIDADPFTEGYAAGYSQCEKDNDRRG